jgi:hypothetical protein
MALVLHIKKCYTRTVSSFPLWSLQEHTLVKASEKTPVKTLYSKILTGKHNKQSKNKMFLNFEETIVHVGVAAFWNCPRNVRSPLTCYIVRSLLITCFSFVCFYFVFNFVYIHLFLFVFGVMYVFFILLGFFFLLIVFILNIYVVNIILATMWTDLKYRCKWIEGSIKLYYSTSQF